MIADIHGRSDHPFKYRYQGICTLSRFDGQQWEKQMSETEQRTSDVAVDNADNDNDRHAGDDRWSEDQPAVLERSWDDVPQEDGTRVDRIVRVARTVPGRRAAGRLPWSWRRLNAAACRRQWRPLGRTNAPVTNIRRFTWEIQPTQHTSTFQRSSAAERSPGVYQSTTVTTVCV